MFGISSSIEAKNTNEFGFEVPIACAKSLAELMDKSTCFAKKLTPFIS